MRMFATAISHNLKILKSAGTGVGRDKAILIRAISDRNNIDVVRNFFADQPPCLFTPHESFHHVASSAFTRGSNGIGMLTSRGESEQHVEHITRITLYVASACVASARCTSSGPLNSPKYLGHDIISLTRTLSCIISGNYYGYKLLKDKSYKVY